MANQKSSSFWGKFKDPYELLVFYDPDFRKGNYNLYDWQIEILKKFSIDSPLDDMLRMAVVAANGSGKSQFILAPCAAWMAVVFPNSLSYITSSSASQLDTQTERFLDSFAEKMNRVHLDINKQEIWKIIKRQKVFLPHKSYIDLFATDEPKKAEGKHPLFPGGEFAIFVDEGKSIEQAIYGAIDRCTGATRRLDISSAGGTFGHFYDINTKPELGWWTRRIKYTDCPHIKQKEAEQLIIKHGLFDPLVRSILFSEFTSVNESVVINREIFDRGQNLFDNSKINLFGNNRMGVDLAAGGDENVGSIWHGNIQIGIEAFHITDTAQGAKEVIHWMEKWKVKPEDCYIEYDGINRGIVDNIIDRDYLVNKVMSGSAAADKRRYANRSAELWFKFKRYIEEGLVKLIPDQTQKDQLCSRYYKINNLTSKIQLESKKEARAAGHPSPDRADACVFAWAGCPTIDEYQNLYLSAPKTPDNRFGKKVSVSALEEVVDAWTYGEKPFFTDKEGNTKENKVAVNCSLSCLEGHIKTDDEAFYRDLSF